MQAVINFGSVLRLHSEAIYKMTTRCQYNSELTTVQDKPRSQSNTGVLTLKTMLWQLILFSSERHWTLRLYHCVVASDIMTIRPTTWSVADLQTAFIYFFFLKRCISVCTKLHAAMYLQIRKRDQTSPAFLLFKTDCMKEKPTNHRGWKPLRTPSPGSITLHLDADHLSGVRWMDPLVGGTRWPAGGVRQHRESQFRENIGNIRPGSYSRHIKTVSSSSS